jgi:CHAD domain-containing protein
MSGSKASHAAHGLGAGSPFHEAASVVLRRRLNTVAESVAKLRDSRDVQVVEPDDIHQVRVSVRRASAAIGVFGPCVSSDGRLRRAKKRLKKLRRAIGTARACDVGLSLLGHDRKASDVIDAEVLHRLERVLSKRRARSLDRVREALDRFSPGRLKRWGKRLTKSIVALHDSDVPASVVTLGLAARRSLSGLVSEIRALGAADLDQASGLHELRLAAKRLRYATEVFGPCFEPERLDEAAKLLVRVQDRLGAANDLSEIIALIDDRMSRADSPRDFAAVRAMYAGRFEACRAEFVPWWRSTGERELLAAYRGLVSPSSGGDSVGIADHEVLSRGQIMPITPGVNGSKA